jgi:hypothetical protein
LRIGHAIAVWIGAVGAVVKTVFMLFAVRLARGRLRPRLPSVMESHRGMICDKPTLDEE